MEGSCGRSQCRELPPIPKGEGGVHLTNKLCLCGSSREEGCTQSQEAGDAEGGCHGLCSPS